jgi:O-antigen/teichoic acid export membrane protein
MRGEMAYWNGGSRYLGLRAMTTAAAHSRPRADLAPAAEARSAELTEAPPAAAPTQDHSARSRVLRNLGVLTGSQVVTWGIALVWTLVIPRAVGPVGMGLLVLYWSAGGVLTTVAGMGTKTLLVREIAADRSQGPALMGASFYLRALTTLPVLVLTLAYIRLGSFTGAQAAVLGLAFFATVVNLLTDPLQAAFQAIERMEYIALGDVMVKLLGAVGAIALVLLGFNAIAIVVLTLAIGCLLLLMYAVQIRGHMRIDLHFRVAALRQLFRESLSFWAFTMSMTIYLWVDSMLLAMLAPPDQVGWYGAPTKLIATMMFVPTIIWAVWLPRLSSSFRRSPDDLREAARVPLDLAWVLGLPVACGAALVAAPLVAFLYGDRFAASVPVFAVLAVTVIPVYLNTAIGYILIASKRQVTWTVVMGGATIANVALNLVLIPAFQRTSHQGALGAAYALVITEFLITAVGVVIIRKVLMRSTLVRGAKTVAATAAMALVVLAVSRFGLLIEVPAGLASFVVFALLIRIPTPAEVGDLLAMGRGGLVRFFARVDPHGRLPAFLRRG